MAGRAGKAKPEDSEFNDQRMRAGAEKKVARSAGRRPTAKKQYLDKPVHELQVHQVELETQNEELQQAQEELKISQKRYFDLYDLAPVGYFSISEKDIILESNLTGANMLGVVTRDLRAQRFTSLIFPEDQDIYNLHHRQLFATQSPQVCEIRMVRRDGSQLWVRIEATLTKDAKSGKTLCLATMSDTTRQKQAELALSRERDRAQGYLDTVETIIVALDTEGRITSINRKGCQLFECREDELIGQLWFSTCLPQPDGMDKVYPVFLKLMAGELEAAEYFENPIVTRSSEVRQVAWHNALLRDEQGRITGTLSSGDDITERKKMQEALLASEERYRLLADNTSDGVWLLDMNLKLIYCSPASEKQSGFTSKEIMDMSLEQYFTPESLKVVSNAFLVELPRVDADPDYNGPFTADLEYYKKDGTSFWAESKFSIIRDKLGKPEHILGLARDITERKRSEEALSDSEEKYRSLVENSGEGICVTQDGLFKFVNRALAATAGLPVDEMTNKLFTDYVHPDDREMIVERESRRVSGEKFDGSYSFRALNKEGQTRWLSLSAVLITWEGKPATLNFLQDVTERKEFVEALRKSEDQYRWLSEHVTDGLWMLDMNLKPTYQSPSMEKLTDFTHKELMELPIEQRVTPESLKLAADLFFELMPGIMADPEYNPTYILELEYYRKDGSTLWTENMLSGTRDKDGNPLSILAEVRNITERKRVEEALRESEELFRVAQEMSPDGFTILHPLRNEKGEIIDFTWVYENKTIARINGTDPEEVKGERMLDLFPTHKGTSIFEAYIYVSNSGKPQIIEEVYVGEIVSRPTWLRLVVVSMGEDIAILAQDISERKIAEEKLAKSYESLQKALNDAINTMVKIVELRDPYTAGHQQKVADLATAIAVEMKFDDTQIEQLRMAATVHDIGKIYVPSDILSKPGKLTNIELSLIRTHAQNGYDIVKGMELPGAIAETILQHHERLDGSGYPNGLKAEDTLMKAKILAVADVVEAMASHRPYRSALGIDKALEEISKNRGRLYDPDVVDACLELFNSDRFEFKPV
jgi:PAS domain S-box-containing protein